jgi:hypothetical protein
MIPGQTNQHGYSRSKKIQIHSVPTFPEGNAGVAQHQNDQKQHIPCELNCRTKKLGSDFKGKNGEVKDAETSKVEDIVGSIEKRTKQPTGRFIHPHNVESGIPRDSPCFISWETLDSEDLVPHRRFHSMVGASRKV